MTSLQSILPSEILARSSTFPIAPSNLPDLEVENLRLQSLIWYLPPADKAAGLKQVYYQNAAWMYVCSFCFATLNYFREYIDVRI